MTKTAASVSALKNSNYSHAGNFAVVVQSYVKVVDTIGIVDKKVVDAPTFIMGGVFGQAMRSADVLLNLLRMWPDMQDSNVYVNGESWIENDSDAVYYVSLSPVLDDI